MINLKREEVYLVSPNERSFLQNAGDRIPLSVCYLGTALRESGYNPVVLDLNHLPNTNAIYFIKNMRPSFVGLSVPSIGSLKQMVEFGEEIKDHTNVVFGGRGITGFENDLADRFHSVVKGYGEVPILSIVGERKQGIIESTDISEFDINEMPIPSRDIVYRDRFNMNYNMMINGVRSAPMITSRGCKYSCAMCSNVEKKPQFRSIENIEEEMRDIRALGYDGIYFYNENFLSDHQKVLEIMGVARQMNLRYRIEARANDITPEIARNLKKTGCNLVAIGFESPDNDVLKAIHKGERLEDYLKATDSLYKHKVPYKGYFMFGLPEQDKHSALNTLKFAEMLKQKGMVAADFYPLVPYPDSPIAKNPDKYGVRILTDDISQYRHGGREQGVVCETNKLNAKQIKEFVEEGRELWTIN